MNEIKKVLVASDQTKNTKPLLKYAIDLALHLNAELTVLHVIDHRDKIKSDEDPQKRILTNTKLLSEKEEEFESIIGAINFKGELNISVITRIGYIHRQIIEISEEENAGLIVLGRKSNGLFFSFESTIDEVISLSKIPVLVVPENVKFYPYKNSLYTTDFLYEDSKSISFLQYLSDGLTCLHVINHDDESSLSSHKMGVLKELFKSNKNHFVIKKGKTSTTILDFADDTRSDLIGLTHKQRGLWNYFFQESICKTIVKKNKVPTIVFQQL